VTSSRLMLASTTCHMAGSSASNLSKTFLTCVSEINSIGTSTPLPLSMHVGSPEQGAPFVRAENVCQKASWAPDKQGGSCVTDKLVRNSTLAFLYYHSTHLVLKFFLLVPLLPVPTTLPGNLLSNRMTSESCVAEEPSATHANAYTRYDAYALAGWRQSLRVSVSVC
jgi:hypothetical protein